VDVFLRFEKILDQGVAELSAATLEPEATAGERAAHLGDSLYRLCLEHGVAWNGFREACITAFAGPSPVFIGRAGKAPEPFAKSVAAHQPLILLALEVMPADPVYGEDASEEDSEDAAEDETIDEDAADDEASEGDAT
jgi:hypothetical protein